MRIFAFGGAVALVGCAAGTALIKAPVENRCAGYGLKGCGELVDGVVLYVNGDKPGALHKLKEAAAENSPQQIRPFAKALKDIVPGEAGAELAEILSGEIAPAQVDDTHPQPTGSAMAAGETAPAAARESDGKVAVAPEVSRTTARMEHVELALVAPVDPSRLLTETVSPRAGGAIQGACDLAGTSGMCNTKPPAGPIVITDAVTPASCKQELFVGAADLEGKFAWFAQTNFPGFHGARFLVKSDQWMAFVARGAPTNKELDERCVVTWAGFRPRLVPFSLGAAPE